MGTQQMAKAVFMLAGIQISHTSYTGCLRSTMVVVLIPCNQHILQNRVFFFKDLIFLQQFQLHNKIERKIQKFSIYPYPHICTASAIINIPHQSGTFFTIKPTVIHHNHPKSIAYIRVHACVSHSMTLEMYNDMYPYIQCHIEYFHCTKNPLCLAIPPPNPCQLLFF